MHGINNHTALVVRFGGELLIRVTECNLVQRHVSRVCAQLLWIRVGAQHLGALLEQFRIGTRGPARSGINQVKYNVVSCASESSDVCLSQNGNSSNGGFQYKSSISQPNPPRILQFSFNYSF